MNLSLDVRLKALRREKGNTQQELAEHLGVSVQAISKWERNEGYPDIATLPLLASYYNVSVDDLLGVGEIRKRKQIEFYNNTYKVLRADLPKRLEMCQAAYKEFPNEPEIVHLLLCTLYVQGLDKNRSEIIRLSHWLLAHYNQAGQYFGAVRNLCYAYGKYGDLEAAKKYAAMGGRYVGTETQLLIHVFQGEDAVKLCESNISWLVDLIAANVDVILKQSQYDHDHCAELVQLVSELYDMTTGISDPEHAEKWKLRLTNVLTQRNHSQIRSECSPQKSNFSCTASTQ